MAHDDRISLLTLEAQRRVFRLAERNHGLTFKAIHLDSGIPYNTIRSYASGEAMMPVSALNKLTDVIPDELLSQLTEPGKRSLVRNDDGDEPDYDAIGQGALELAGEVAKSRRPDSPGGTNIVPIEKEAINSKLAPLARRRKAA
jgi:hypothetical protein